MSKLTNTFEDEIRKKALEVAELVIKKQRDYGKKNILNTVVDPKLAVAVRLQDKVARLANLTQFEGTPHHESLADTASDIAGYGLITLMLVEDTFSLPMQEQ